MVVYKKLCENVKKSVEKLHFLVEEKVYYFIKTA